MDTSQFAALLEQLPLPSRTLVDQWVDEVNGGGEATLAEADYRLALCTIAWYKCALLEAISASFLMQAAQQQQQLRTR